MFQHHACIHRRGQIRWSDDPHICLELSVKRRFIETNTLYTLHTYRGQPLNNLSNDLRHKVCVYVQALRFSHHAFPNFSSPTDRRRRYSTTLYVKVNKLCAFLSFHSVRTNWMLCVIVYVCILFGGPIAITLWLCMGSGEKLGQLRSRCGCNPSSRICVAMIAERGLVVFAIGVVVFGGFCGGRCLADTFRIGRRAKGKIVLWCEKG